MHNITAFLHVFRTAFASTKKNLCVDGGMKASSGLIDCTVTPASHGQPQTEKTVSVLLGNRSRMMNFYTAECLRLLLQWHMYTEIQCSSVRHYIDCVNINV